MVTINLTLAERFIYTESESVGGRERETHGQIKENHTNPK
jgi:hypothetical protein